MAINLVRDQPKEVGIAAVKMGAKHVLAKKLKTDELTVHLKNLGKLPSVTFEDEANQACRNNNAEKVALAEDVPTMFGNTEAYSAVLGGDKAAVCEEYTMCQYMGDSALEFIGL